MQESRIPLCDAEKIASNDPDMNTNHDQIMTKNIYIRHLKFAWVCARCLLPAVCERCVSR